METTLDPKHIAGMERARALQAKFRATLPPAPEECPEPPRLDPSIPILEPETFVTTAQLLRDTQSLIAKLPPDIDLVVAISRSGLLPGSIVAFDLHLPILTVSRQKGIQDPGHGGRMENRESSPPKHILLIDDTVANGREMRECLPIVRERFPDTKITKAVIYAHPRSLSSVDLFVYAYPGLHFLAWNFQNAGHGASAAYDFDGIICRDFTQEECSTWERYTSTMETIEPLYLPRRAPVKKIVTARPESTRAITEAWLDRYGVKFEELVMWRGDPHPQPEDVAQYKALHYLDSDCELFIESDPLQARRIAETTGLSVLCPALGKLLPGKNRTGVPRRKTVVRVDPPQGSAPRFDAVKYRKLKKLVDACPDRGCKIGCQKTRCERIKGEVYLSDCMACVETGNPPERVQL